MKTRIIKINNIEFGIGAEYLECPYTEEYFKKKWIAEVTPIIQTSKTSNIGSHWILDCKDLDLVLGDTLLNESRLDEFTYLLSDSVDIQNTYRDSNKPIIVITDPLNIFVRIK